MNDDYIKRSDARDAIRRQYLYSANRSKYSAVIDSIPAADVRPVVRGEWISVKERLPDDWVDVLTVSTRGNFHVLYHAATFEHPFGIGEDHPRYWPVTHWMPLPEPPEEENV